MTLGLLAVTLLCGTTGTLAAETPGGEPVYHGFSQAGKGITAVAISPDGQTAITGSQDGVLRVWDLASGKLTRKLTGHTGHLAAVAILPGGHQALSASLDNTLRLWSLATGEELGRLQNPPVPGEPRTYWKSQGISISADGLRAVTRSGRRVHIWDLENRKHLLTLPPYTGRLEAVAISSDGKSLLTGGSDARVRLWDIASGREIRVLRGHTDSVRSVTFSPDGHLAASGARDRRVIVWDLASGHPLRKYRDHSGCGTVHDSEPAGGKEPASPAEPEGRGDPTRLATAQARRSRTTPAGSPGDRQPRRPW